MKTTISVPNQLYKASMKAARKMKLSRSAFYAKAVEEFIEHQAPDDLTSRLDRVYASEPSSIDPVLAKAQSRSIRNKESW